jgi:hypothetical protein
LAGTPRSNAPLGPGRLLGQSGRTRQGQQAAPSEARIPPWGCEPEASRQIGRVRRLPNQTGANERPRCLRSRSAADGHRPLPA